MYMSLLKGMSFCMGLLAMLSCSDDYVEESTTEIADQPETLTDLLAQYNEDIAAMQAFLEGDAEIVDYTVDESGTYRLLLNDGTISTATSRTGEDTDIPLFGVDENGYWTVLSDGETNTLTDLSGDSVPALRKTGKGVYTPQIAVGSDGYWLVSFNGEQWKQLSTSPAADMTGKSVVNFSLYRTVEMDESGEQLTLVVRNGGTELTVKASASISAEAWKKFVMKSDENVLLDFSYAGYDHGETAPPDVTINFNNRRYDTDGNPYYIATLTGGVQTGTTYKVYDVTDYGAVADDDVSDRSALITILKDVMGCTETNTEDDGKTLRYYISGNNANAIIYFPEGRYILRGGDDSETVETLRLTMGNLIIKGAGADKTVIEMAVQNNAATDDMWSTPNMLEIKHNSGMSDLTEVTEDASQGSFSVKVSSTSDISVGDWVCLTLVNNDQELIAQELSPHEWSSTMTEFSETGVQVYDLHQVKSIANNTLTFVEPIMHEVEAQWNWVIQKYPHYENVGIEDLTFLGHAKEEFRHHGSAEDDGAFKPINLIRVTNSWIRRVDFESVSEAASIVSSANVSAYTVNITGNRGHSAIRSQSSSRVFIGDVTDASDGNILLNSGGSTLGDYMEGAGQYHACGVSKPSMGAVIWNVTWGNDACFESHATQPRATLIDRCTGAFIPWREGGDASQLPNHLDDLTIWNMNATLVDYASGWGNEFIWWDDNSTWWKNMPPVIVGFHGASIVFDESEEQIKYIESNGTAVEPQSLYEAQLERRLGYVPAWLTALK